MMSGKSRGFVSFPGPLPRTKLLPDENISVSEQLSRRDSVVSVLSSAGSMLQGAGTKRVKKVSKEER